MADNAKGRREQLELATGERISALEGIGDATPATPGVAAKGIDGNLAGTDRSPDRVTEIVGDEFSDRSRSSQTTPEPAPPGREKRIEMDLEL